MIYLANPTSTPVRDAMAAGLLGAITTPDQRNVLPAGAWWCADNGAFGKGYPGDGPWLDWLDRQPWSRDRCLFAVAPDVVGDAERTLARSEKFLPAIRAMGYPAAFVAQNGVQHTGVPWDDVDCLFLGGGLECPRHGFVPSPRITGGTGHMRRHWCPECDHLLTEWKLGAYAEELASLARSHGKWVHMGRVNTRQRLRHAHAIGCDSADGTTLTRGARRNLPPLLRWLAELEGTR